MRANKFHILIFVLLSAMTSYSCFSNHSSNPETLETPVLVTDADEIYKEFHNSQEPIDAARHTAHGRVEDYIKSKIGTNFNIDELDFSFVRYSYSLFDKNDDAIFKVKDYRFRHELYVIGTVDARHVTLDNQRTYRLNGTFKEEDHTSLLSDPVGVVGKATCLSFGMLRFEPLEVNETDNPIGELPPINF